MKKTGGEESRGTVPLTPTSGVLVSYLFLYLTHHFAQYFFRIKSIPQRFSPLVPTCSCPLPSCKIRTSYILHFKSVFQSKKNCMFLNDFSTAKLVLLAL
jgi:hypothetical protein